MSLSRFRIPHSGVQIILDMERQTLLAIFVLLVLSSFLITSTTSSSYDACSFGSRRFARICKRNQVRNKVVMDLGEKSKER